MEELKEPKNVVDLLEKKLNGSPPSFICFANNKKNSLLFSYSKKAPSVCWRLNLTDYTIHEGDADAAEQNKSDLKYLKEEFPKLFLGKHLKEPIHCVHPGLLFHQPYDSCILEFHRKTRSESFCKHRYRVKPPYFPIRATITSLKITHVNWGKKHLVMVLSVQLKKKKKRFWVVVWKREEKKPSALFEVQSEVGGIVINSQIIVLHYKNAPSKLYVVNHLGGELQTLPHNYEDSNRYYIFLTENHLVLFLGSQLTLYRLDTSSLNFIKESFHLVSTVR